MLSKVFPINLKPGKQAEAESIVETFAQTGPKQEAGTLSFRVYRDRAKPDYLLLLSTSPITARMMRIQAPPRIANSLLDSLQN